MSLGEGAFGEKALGEEAGPPPPPIDPLFLPRRWREIFGGDPPLDEIPGETTRREGVPEDVVNPPAVILFKRWRSISGGDPPLDEIPGETLRREGVPEDVIPGNRIAFLRRLIEGGDPPLDEIEGIILRREAKPPAWLEFFQTFGQAFRIADDSLAVYELFVGVDAPVDFSATGQPVATSTTLPFMWTPPLPGTGATSTLHIVVRLRNKYNLQSFNVMEKLLVIDSIGAEVLGPITPPFDVRVYNASPSGSIRVIAKYIDDDDSTPADEWEVYAEVGVDPIPGTDTPVFSGTSAGMDFIGNEAVMNEVISGFTPSDTLHIIVCAVRSSDLERGCAAVVQHVVTPSLDLTDGFLFGGEAYEQR